MGTVTYKHQPGIAASHGHVPLAGGSHVYTVSKILWPEAVEDFLRTLFVGSVLHLCCGKSRLGDCRVDNDPECVPDVIADVTATGFPDESWDTVLCDPPYNGKMQWNHDLLTEIGRVAHSRIIFQHWFIPADIHGKWKKWTERWELSGVYVWQPRTYFGRVQVISVFDRVRR